MKIPKFWHKEEQETEIDGQPHQLTAWGHSFNSMQEAAQNAVERMTKIVEALGRDDSDRDSYDYLANPMREMIIDQFGPEEDPFALISRNGYGSLVLNTGGVMFIDIDLPPPGCLFILGGGSDEQRKAAAIESVKQTASDLGDLRFRLYETTMGLRLLVENKLFDPEAEATLELMDIFCADPMYIRLCKSQKCFRARISPKPWRIDVERPAIKYPTGDELAAYQQWTDNYNRKAKDYSTCKYIDTIGGGSAIAEAEQIVKIHDRHCRVEERLPLA